MRTPELDEVLSVLPIFACLRPDERVRVAARMKRILLEPGQSYAQSAEAPALVVVASGELSLQRGTETALLFPGDSVGDAESLAGRGPAEVLTALEPSILAVLDRAAIDGVLGDFPICARPWVAELGRELKWRNDLMREVLLARAQGWSQAQLSAVLRSRRRRLQRRRHHPIRRVGALLGRVLFAEPARRPAFWILAGAVLALASARGMVGWILANGMQHRLFALIGNAAGNPIHVHHFNYGLLLVSLVGLLSMAPRLRRILRLMSFVFGFGMGLVVDEFALLWNLNPDYYQPSSRLAAGLVLFALFQVVYFRTLYVAIARRLIAGLFA
jgi:CRP-like cAMP-binding protein